MHIPIAFFLFCSILGSKNKYTTHYAQELDAHVLRGIPQGDAAYKQQNQASRIGLPDLMLYSQKVTRVTRKNFA